MVIHTGFADTCVRAFTVLFILYDFLMSARVDSLNSSSTRRPGCKRLCPCPCEANLMHATRLAYIVAFYIHLFALLLTPWVNAVKKSRAYREKLPGPAGSRRALRRPRQQASSSGVHYMTVAAFAIALFLESYPAYIGHRSDSFIVAVVARLEVLPYMFIIVMLLAGLTSVMVIIANSTDESTACRCRCSCKVNPRRKATLQLADYDETLANYSNRTQGVISQSSRSHKHSQIGEPGSLRRGS